MKKKERKKRRWPYIPPSMKKVTYHILLNYLYSSIEVARRNSLNYT
jgi:hypothetical protein